MRIFVADNSPIIRERLKSMMEAVGGIDVVGESANYSESISEIRRTRPDVILVDMNIAGGTGIDLLSEIHEQDWTVTKIVLSDYSTPPYRNACMMAGADYFFDKAMDYKKLRQLIRGLASSRMLSDVDDALYASSKRKRH